MTSLVDLPDELIADIAKRAHARTQMRFVCRLLYEAITRFWVTIRVEPLSRAKWTAMRQHDNVRNLVLDYVKVATSKLPTWTTITALAFEHYLVSTADCDQPALDSALSALPNLTQLCVVDSPFTLSLTSPFLPNFHLQHLTQIRLEELSLGGCDLSLFPASVTHFAMVKTTEWRTRHYQEIARLTNLVHLELPVGCVYSESAFEGIAKSLQKMRFFSCPSFFGYSATSTVLQTIVASWPRLRALHIGNSFSKPLQRDHLTALSCLEQLSLREIVSESTLDEIGQRGLLKRLSLNMHQFSYVDMLETMQSVVSCSPHLTHITLKYMLHVVPYLIEDIVAARPPLVHFNMKGHQLLDSHVVSLLRTFPHLQHLVLTSAALGVDTLNAVAFHCKSLRVLKLGCLRNVTDEAFANLVHAAAGIHTASFANITNVSELGLQSLAQWPSLTKLSMRRDAPFQESVVFALRKAPLLRQLCVNYVDGCEVLVRKLQANRSRVAVHFRMPPGAHRKRMIVM
eukprot:TRINITY_DN7374_c0_g1_i2.p1 TRINITY_DN7374_c0_g1~~TRINITY_DN7374_c0_g1_i2.p1  ORF type:complete len:513 (+),score=78.40 TRINITY_DN7374_c0_g1_i2:30-1568(+)